VIETVIVDETGGRSLWPVISLACFNVVNASWWWCGVNWQ